MKLLKTNFLIFLLLLISFNSSYSQEEQELNLKYKEPVTLNLAGAGLKQIFFTFGKIGRLNILFDDGIVLTKIVENFSVKELPFEKALRVLLETNNLSAISIDDETIIVFPSEKFQYYIKNSKVYKLSYIEVNKLVPIIQTIFGAAAEEKTKTLFKLIVEEKSNLLIVLATSETRERIDRLIKDIDQKLQQAIIELKIVEASKEKQREYGIELLDYQFSTTKLVKNSLERVTAYDFPALLKYLQTDSTVKILASPNIRVINKQKAQITIGSQVPIQISTTQISTPTGGGAPSSVTTTQVQFYDIGIKLVCSPTIHLDNEITIELAVEVTSIDKITALGIPEIGRRTATTTIRLKNEETAIMGGLKREEQRESMRGLPFLSDIPFIGLIFRRTTTQIIESEIILSITPHIIPVNFVEEQNVR